MKVGLEQLIGAGLGAYVEESRRYNAAAAAVAGPTGPEELRRARERQAADLTQSAGRAVERIAAADGRQVPVRITVPETTGIRGVYLDIHGGGFYLGSAARNDARNAQLADAVGVVVVSVDYRLAPEHPWPAAPDDCEIAARWVVDQAESLCGTTNLVIGGFSAGSNLVLTTLLRLRDRGPSPFLGAVLPFGAYDLSGRTPGGRLYADEYFIDAYVGQVTDRTEPDISPIYADLAALPPTLLVVGGLDPVLEDSLAMAGRLCSAGNDVDLRVYPESGHGFTSSPTSMAAAATRDIESWLIGRLSERRAVQPAARN